MGKNIVLLAEGNRKVGAYDESICYNEYCSLGARPMEGDDDDSDDDDPVYDYAPAAWGDSTFNIIENPSFVLFFFITLLKVLLMIIILYELNVFNLSLFM